MCALNILASDLTSDRRRAPVYTPERQAGLGNHGRLASGLYRPASDYTLETVNHAAEEYVRGRVHNNGMENFWSLLKRSLGGTYVSVEPFHLSRYLDEQAFRFNERKGNEVNASASRVVHHRPSPHMEGIYRYEDAGAAA